MSIADILMIIGERFYLNKNGETRVCTLDSSKAFDKFWHSDFLHKFKGYEISGRFFNWMNIFVSIREVKVALDGHLSRYFVLIQVSIKYSILGPTLFLILIFLLASVLELIYM